MHQKKTLRTTVQAFALAVVTAIAAAGASSCATAGNPYARMREVSYGGGRVYVFNPGQDRVLVYLDGSGMHSALGVKGVFWTEVGFAWFLSRFAPRDTTVVVPERLDFKPGGDYSASRRSHESYTAENLASGYVRTVDAYLDSSGAREVYLLGVSEGGLLAPLVYNRLKNRDRIVKLAVWGAGGLSQDEAFRALGASSVPMDARYREQCLKIDEAKALIAANPDSVDRWYLGWTYRRWSSFFAYRPLDELARIEIPVLFIQGSHDSASPVESVRFVEESLPEKPFVYDYREGMGHIPEDEGDIETLLAGLFAWLRG